MINRPVSLILFAFFLYGSVNFCPDVSAQDENRLPEETNAQKNRPEQPKLPVVILNRTPPEYEATGMRDPFQSGIIKETKVSEQKAQAPEVPSEPEIDPSSLKVQGIIWGTKLPQAIINDKVYIVGDKIENAEIISIEKSGVNLECASGIVGLSAPGENNIPDGANLTKAPGSPVPHKIN